MLLFLFPIRTDAPIYHFPFATLWLIGLNVCAFVVTWIMPIVFDVGDFYDYQRLLCITLGGTIEPIKWLTATFFHFDPGHLIFNMLFLWTFGLLVEGKLGWRKFLGCYLLIGVGGSAVIQLIVFGMDGTNWAGGASVAISGLMLMSYLWAPKNDVGIAYFLWILFFIRLGEFQITISTFVLVYLFLQGVSASLQGTFLTSEFMHGVGFVIGGLLGTWMVKKKKVDCEGWDLFSVMKGEHGRKFKEAIYDEVDADLRPSGSWIADKKRRRSAIEKRRNEQRESAKPAPAGGSNKPATAEETVARIHQLLRARKTTAAVQMLNARRQFDDRFELPGPDLLRLAQQLHEADQTDESVRHLTEYVTRHPDGSEKVRLTLASLMVQIQSRPAAALRVLEPVTPAELTDVERRKMAAIVKKANEMIDDGVIEFGDGAW